MGLIFRKRIPLGPFLRVNLSRRPSVSAKLGPVTRNITRRRTTVNLPGPWSWRGRRGR